MDVRYRDIKTPVGPVRVAWADEGLVRVDTGGQLDSPVPEGWGHDSTLECDAIDQLRDYFAGKRREFDLPLVLSGTAFQKRVWEALMAIPYGKTISYTELARMAGNERAPRAAGAANARNPIAIVVPCHRVIGASGRLTGYAGGLAVKKRLIELESSVAAQ